MAKYYYYGDYMHCSQDRCPRHEECWRYELGKMCKGIATFYTPDKDEDLSKCEYFLNKENYRMSTTHKPKICGLANKA